MPEKDYYSILGVSESAGEKDIRKAFRSLAKKWHPDANKGDKDAERRFKEISEANEVLSDKDKRAQYDQLRKAREMGFGAGDAGGFDFSNFGRGQEGASGFDMGGSGISSRACSGVRRGTATRLGAHTVRKRAKTESIP